MKIEKCKKNVLIIFGSLLCANLLGIATIAHASGFVIPVKSISDLGNEFAGGAALASDASTNYYNPAGDVLIKHPELIVGVAYVFSPASFEGTAIAANLLPLPLPSYQATGVADTDQQGFLPTLHFVSPIYRDQLFFGLSVTTPAGLGSDFGDDSILRYSTVKASAQVANIGPSLALKITNKLSVGAGPDFQYFKAKFTNHGYIPLSNDAEIDTIASSWGYGWHAGLLYQFVPGTRVGLSYTSKITQHMEGTSSFMPPVPLMFPINEFISPNAKITLSLPPSTLFSIYHELNNKWAVMGTVGYTQWSVFEDVTIDNAATPYGPIKVVMPENFHDTWSFAAAVNYKLNEQWLLRAGVGTDGAASDDHCRDAITPDSSWIATNIGFHFQPIEAIGWDVGYSHSFNKDAKISHVNTANGTAENGIYSRQGNVLGLQMVVKLDRLSASKK